MLEVKSMLVDCLMVLLETTSIAANELCKSNLITVMAIDDTGGIKGH
jgi:hypothetical protein